MLKASRTTQKYRYDVVAEEHRCLLNIILYLEDNVGKYE